MKHRKKVYISQAELTQRFKRDISKALKETQEGTFVELNKPIYITEDRKTFGSFREIAHDEMEELYISRN